MKLLLDTNALLWFGSSPGDLGKKTKKLYSEATAVYFSTISIFELQIKQAKSKLRVDPDLVERFAERGILELAPKASDALEITRFKTLLAHDPFDRMILAQAAANELTLVTSDRKLIELGFNWIHNARD